MQKMLLTILFNKWRRLAEEGKTEELEQDLDKAIAALEDEGS